MERIPELTLILFITKTKKYRRMSLKHIIYVCVEEKPINKDIFKFFMITDVFLYLSILYCVSRYLLLLPLSLLRSDIIHKP